MRYMTDERKCIMSKLDEARSRINAIDAEMARLFEQRLDAVGDVLEYKRANDLPVFDGGREQQVVEKNLKLLQNPEYSRYYRQFILHLMDLSKDYQRSLLHRNAVAYAGAEGAFAWQAASRLFPTYSHLACQDFESVFIDVLEDRAAFGVIPFENSYTGEVGEVFDLLFRYDCHIQGIYDLPVRQNLLALPGAVISDIRKVYSHPQALGQCAKFLHEHGLETVDYDNTALAAKFVAESNDRSLAAIASIETAELYGLSVLAEGINVSRQNTTRFIVISRELKTGGNRFNLLFTVGHNAGQLARVMSLIGDMGFNMESIKSRPVRELPWQYYFYVEIEGSLDDERADELLRRMKDCCDTCKVLGSYNIF